MYYRGFQLFINVILFNYVGSVFTVTMYSIFDHWPEAIDTLNIECYFTFNYDYIRTVGYFKPYN